MTAVTEDFEAKDHGEGIIRAISAGKSSLYGC